MSAVEFNMILPTFIPRNEPVKITDSRNLLVEYVKNQYFQTSYNINPD